MTNWILYMPYYQGSIGFAHKISTWRFSINQNTYLRSDLSINYFNGTLNCNHCSFTVRNNKSDSSPRDLIITGSVKKVENLNSFMRTLRHTGCKCTVVILLDEQAYQFLTKDMILDIERCGGQIINMGEPEFTKLSNHFTLIYLWTYYIVKRNYYKFDRIMKCDMFDTVFQGDPFNKMIEPGKFYMIEETKQSLRGMYNHIATDLGIRSGFKETFICAGISCGYIEPFTHALDVYFSYFRWDRGWCDQHLFNILYSCDFFKYHNVDLVALRPNETIRHLYTMRTDGEMGSITGIYNNKAYATVLHHIHVAPILLDSIRKYCPNNNEALKNYVTEFRQSG